MKPVVTALIGLGYWGPNLLRNFAAQPMCKLKYACDLKEDLLKKHSLHYPAIRFIKDAKKTFYDPEVELVLIATPTSTHFELAKKALESGKHVFIEKPMCGNSKDAETLVKLAKKKKKKIFVDHTFAFTQAVKKIQDLTPKLGQLLYFDSTRINLGLIQKDTNVFWDLAVHDLTILASIKDLRGITELCAHGSSHYGKQTEVGHLYITFKDGFMAHISVSWLSPVKIRHTILAGTKAMITYDDTEPSEKLRIYDKAVERDTTKPDPFFPAYRSGDVVIPALSLAEALGTEAAHVLKCIHGGEQPMVSGEDGVRMIKILELADLSIKKNAPVKAKLS